MASTDTSPALKAPAISPPTAPAISPMKRTASGSGELQCYKIVFTGGPCAGKTTALARVSNFLRSRGFTVYSVPEAATLIFQNGGAFFDQGAEEDVIVFQTKLIKLQMHLEDTFEELARTSAARTAAAAGKQGGKRPVGSQKAVLLCDRGTLDGSAYMDAAGWAKLMAHNGMDTVTLRDQRYNAVFHLVTAADGAEEHRPLLQDQRAEAGRTPGASAARAKGGMGRTQPGGQRRRGRHAAGRGHRLRTAGFLQADF